MRTVTPSLFVLMLSMGAPMASAQVVEFSRDTDTISIAAHTNTPNAITIEARALLTEPNVELANIWGEQTQSPEPGEDKNLVVFDGGFFGSAWTGPNYRNRTQIRSGPLPVGRWVHLAFVRDAAEERLYVDGSLVDAGAWTEPMVNIGGSRMSIGAFQNTTRYFPSFIGLMDWLRVSKVARYTGNTSPVPGCEPQADSDTELLFLFNELAGSPFVFDETHRFVGSLGVGHFANPTRPSIICPVPVVTDHPVGRVACPAARIDLNVRASLACAGAPVYVWRKNGFALSDGRTGCGSVITGSRTPDLRIDNACPEDTGAYDCVVANNCGSIDSDDALLTVVRCYADCDCGTGPGILDIFDFLCFQNRFAQSDPYACNCDTSTGPNLCDIFDFLCFQNAYAAGCP